MLPDVSMTNTTYSLSAAMPPTVLSRALKSGAQQALHLFRQRLFRLREIFLR